MSNIIKWYPDFLENDSMWVYNSLVAQNTYFYVRLAGRYLASPKFFTERQGDNAYMLLYTLSGMGFLLYQGKQYFLKPHSVFLIDCDENHFYNTVGPENWEFLELHICGATTAEYYRQFASGGNVLFLKPENEVLPLVQEILHMNLERRVHREILTSECIVRLLTSLILTQHLSASNESYGPEYVNNISAYIEQNFHLPLTIDGLAQKYSISKYHLCREFKRVHRLFPQRVYHILPY